MSSTLGVITQQENEFHTNCLTVKVFVSHIMFSCLSSDLRISDGYTRRRDPVPRRVTGVQTSGLGSDDEIGGICR